MGARPGNRALPSGALSTLANHPAKGHRARTLTPAQPSRPETRPRARGPSSTRGSKPSPPGPSLLFSLLLPVSSFLLPVRRRTHPWLSVVGVATLDRFAHRLHQSHPRMQSLPHCRVSIPPTPSRRLSLLEADGAQARVCNKYVCVRVYLVYVRGIADAGFVGETKNASLDCNGEV